MISPISMIFGILLNQKEWSNFRKILFIFLQVKKRLRYRHLLKTAFLQKNVNNFKNPKTDFSPTSANKPQSSLVLYLQVRSQS